MANLPDSTRVCYSVLSKLAMHVDILVSESQNISRLIGRLRVSIQDSVSKPTLYHVGWIEMKEKKKKSDGVIPCFFLHRQVVGSKKNQLRRLLS